MPGAEDLNQYWDNLVNGRESITFFSKEELDSTLDPRDTNAPNYVPARGIIKDADHFDARFFRTPPRNAELTCPQQRIMLELAWTALEDAGIIPNKSEQTIGVWAGTYSTSYFVKNILTNPELVRQTGEFQVGVYNEKDYIATRVAHALNLTGPAITAVLSMLPELERCSAMEQESSSYVVLKTRLLLAIESTRWSKALESITTAARKQVSQPRALPVNRTQLRWPIQWRMLILSPLAMSKLMEPRRRSAIQSK